MGDVADMMLEGVLCQQCGEYIEPDVQGEPEGIPRTCYFCEPCCDSDID